MSGLARAVLYLLAAYAITLPSGLIEGQAGASGDLLAALKLACLAAFAWHAAAVLSARRGGAAASALALAATTGLVWAALAGMWLYKVVALQPFDFLAVMFALEDARRTLVAVLGAHGVALALGALALLVLAASGAAWLLLRLARTASARLAPGPRVAALCFGVLTYLVAADLWHAANELVLYARWAAGRPFNLPAPLVPDYSAIAIGSKESVFVLQLESVNAHAVFERTGDAGYRARIPQPGVETLLKEGGGIFFPLFWANGAGTNRAWESVLCAVGGNAGPPFSADPVRLARRTCLPAKLAGSGYATVFLYAYFDLDFFNFGAFAKRAGFQDVAYGPRLMAEGDRRFPWAYDDCVFYRRAFEYLAKQGLDRRERVLAYFEVGMNHAPFFGTMKHPEAHPYRKPRSQTEHYLNAVAEQDHCLLEFWRGFRALGRDDIHLFVLPDHGMSVPGMPPMPDAFFATWLAYVPPARRQAEFRPRVVHAPVPSQAQLYATILELLGGQPAPASFAFALRGEPAPARYEDCHTLGAPGQRLVVHRNGERTEFRPRTGEVLTPSGQRVAADSGTFHERFGCAPRPAGRQSPDSR